MTHKNIASVLVLRVRLTYAVRPWIRFPDMATAHHALLSMAQHSLLAPSPCPWTRRRKGVQRVCW